VRVTDSDPDRQRQWLFAYGSLAAQPPGPISRSPGRSGVIADLAGFRRTWGVAMDNRMTVAGYKHYVDPVTGPRPAVYVAFLDLEPCTDGGVNGICIPVTAERLAVLDRRERQYVRVDVRDRMPMVSGPVWVYVGSEEGRRRRREGDHTGRTVAVRDYVSRVRRAFDGLGAGEREAFELSTGPVGCPVRTLWRREVAGVPAPAEASAAPRRVRDAAG